jgi:hypothetical protein
MRKAGRVDTNARTKYSSSVNLCTSQQQKKPRKLKENKK